LDKVVGLELGGDDYIPKPFSPRELVARVRAVLRRGSPLAGPATTNERVTHGLLVMDAARFEVWWGDAPIVLTVTEFALLRCLVSSPGRVFTRSQLMQAAYDEPHVVSDRTIDSHIRRLRKKLGVVGCTLLETVHGMGYKV
jgi:two-component system OmpR family response regulator